VYVSSDSEEMLKQAEAIGAIPILRGEELCGDVPNIPVYKHAVKQMQDCDGIVAVQANSPTIEPNLIVVAKRIMEMGVDELMTCDKNYAIYGSIWALTKKLLFNYPDPYRPKPDVLIIDTSTDIHTERDYILALKQNI